jgi:hypothetical protein
MYSSDTECTRRTNTSIRSLQSNKTSNRYVRGLGSHQDLSKRTASLSSPNISEIIHNHETFALLAEFLQLHGRESLIGFCAIVIGIGNLSSDQRQANYAVRAAYRQYLHDPSISSYWLQTSTRERIREQIAQRTFDPYQIFQPAMKDIVQYLKQNFYANFLSSKLWKNYLIKQQQEKRMKTINASTPKKINLSISTSTIKSSKTVHGSKREIRTNFTGNKTLGTCCCFLHHHHHHHLIIWICQQWMTVRRSCSHMHFGSLCVSISIYKAIVMFRNMLIIPYSTKEKDFLIMKTNAL